MKQKLLIFALMFALGTVSATAQKHRHHAVTDSAKATVVAADTTAKDEIEAFSDTTSVADAALDEDFGPTSYGNYDYYDDVETPPEWLVNFLGGSLGVLGGTFGIVVAILTILFALLILIGPFILLILVLRHLVRQHNDRVMLAQKAMETGQPIPEELMPTDKQSDEYLRRRGIRNIWIGIGMAMMFGIWGADMLTGVGVLVLCYGIGQVMIARSSRKKNELDR